MGELPEGWKYSTLLDAVGGVASLVVGGPFGSCLKVEHYLNEGVPIIRLQNIGRRKFIKKDIKYVSPEKAEELRYHSYQSGDLVLAKLGDPIGKTCIIPDGEENGIVVSDAVRIRNANKNLSSKYLMYILNSDSVSRQLNKQVFGTTRPRVNLQEVRQLVFPLPPFPVQRQIVAVLEHAEAVKRQRQEADALMGALLQSVFREMFGDPVRNEKGWDIAIIEEICDEITVGIVVRPASYYVESGVPAFRSLNIRPDKLNLENFVYINASDNDTVLSKSKIRSGDVLVVRTGYPGTACVVPPEFDGANCIDLIILRPKKHLVNCNYLSRFLNSEYGKAQTLAGNTGLAQQHLNIGAIRQVKISLPPLALQQQFSRVVQDVERIRERQLTSGEEIEGLCEGLMQRAFAGELVG